MDSNRKTRDMWGLIKDMDATERLKLYKRFFDKVDTTGSCWEWTGAVTPKGYGMVSISGQKAFTHRVARVLADQESIANKQVNHHCSNPSCVHPKHTYVGSHSDNLKDMYENEEVTRESMPSSKLTEDEVREIRRKLKEGATGTKLAEEYDTSPTNIYKIRDRRSWPNVFVE